MATRTPPANSRRFEAIVDGRPIELVVSDDEVTVDGRSLHFSHERMSDRQASLLVDGRSYSATVLTDGNGAYTVYLDGTDYEVSLKSDRDLLLERFGLADEAGSGRVEIRAPMPGLVLSLAVSVGDEIDAGSGLLVLEAMKMENELRTERAGVVKAIHAAPGDAVGKNDLLVELE